MDQEIAVKTARLAAYLRHHALDGVLLWTRANFAWVTGGRDNHIGNSSPVGVAAMLATADGQRVCLTNTIESPRFREEELVGTGVDVVEYDWHDADAGRRTVRDVIAGRRVAADADVLDLSLPPVPGDFPTLRYSLTPAEIGRYREGARRASIAMETACRRVQPGLSEHEIGGLLDHEVHAAGCNPVVCLIAADGRVRSFRHPIPTDHVMREYVMLVSCAEYGGLISNLTRFVHVGPMPEALRRRHQAVADVDATVNFATRPGRTLGEVFEDLRAAYAHVGHADEWRLHHQGGPTGYAGRDALAVPGSDVVVRDNQAFAWNPSITGTKSEDTVLITPQGVELLTAPTPDWPTLDGHAPDGRTLRRATMLEV